MKCEECPSSPRSVAEIIAAIGDLMRDCHRQSLALQDAATGSLSPRKVTPERLKTYQSLDHLTQVHADLARLLPALSRTLQHGHETNEDLTSTLRLASLRKRLLGSDQDRPVTVNDAGEVHFF